VRGTLRVIPAVAMLLAALLVGALMLGSRASTASVSVPDTVIATGEITINGARLFGFSHLSESKVIYGSTIYLIGEHRNSTIKVRFGSGPYITCKTGNKIKQDRSPDLTEVSCSGLRQRTDESSTFTIVVS